MASALRASDPKPSCEGCFFGRQQLCALELDAPCATFRPDSPEGLRPQRQLRFAFRTADAAPDTGVPATGLPMHTPPVHLPMHAAPRRSTRRRPGARPEQPMLTPSLMA